MLFTTGGTEAIEHAVRMARLHTGRQKVMAAYRSYHGATAGAIGLTGDPRRWANEPGIPGVVRFFDPYKYRSHLYRESHAGIPSGLKLVPEATEMLTFRYITD